jgi:hypothetical protein
MEPAAVTNIAEPVPPRQTPVQPRPEDQPALPTPAAYDPQLFEQLRNWRSQQAKAQNLPPYIIFPNKVLEIIAAQQPTSLADLGLISGIGRIKLEQYGQAVITLITNYLNGQQPQLPPTPAQSKAEPQNPKPQIETLPNPKPIEDPSKSKIQNPKSKIDPGAAILSVVNDLPGLLTLDNLAQLLTAGPEEIVSFSDHDLFAVFHGRLAAADILSQIQAMLQDGQLRLNWQRLDLP